MYVEPSRPYSLFLEYGSAAKTLISHPHNTASYATQAMLSYVRSRLSRQQDQAKLPLPSPPLHTRQLTRQSRGDPRLGQGAKQPRGARW